jgi:hypothetical protein
VSAATVMPDRGDLFVSRDNGFQKIKGGTEIQAGDSVKSTRAKSWVVAQAFGNNPLPFLIEGPSTTTSPSAFTIRSAAAPTAVGTQGSGRQFEIRLLEREIRILEFEIRELERVLSLLGVSP